MGNESYECKISKKAEQMVQICFQDCKKSCKCKNCNKVCNQKFILSRDYCPQNVIETPNESEHHKKLPSSDLTHLADKKPFKCVHCKKAFYMKYYLTRHLCAHNINPNSIVCEHCGKTFTNNYNLNRHICTHTGEKPFKCQYCNKSFSQNAHMLQHESIHINEKSLKCKICKISFDKNSELSVHMQTHTKIFLCEYCKKSFHTKYHWVRHIQSHTNSKPFQCNHCKKSFREKYQLKNHIQIHNKVKLFKCEQCQASFFLRINLLKHYRSSHQKKPFECEYCKRTYGEKRYLIRHIEATHFGEKSYKCKECKIAFFRKNDLSQHHLSLTHIKNCNKCKNCNILFDCKYDLQSHSCYTNKNSNRLSLDAFALLQRFNNFSNDNLKIQSNVNCNQIIASEDCNSCDHLNENMCKYEKYKLILPTNEVLFKCQQCNCLLKDESNLIKHDCNTGEKYDKLSLNACVLLQRLTGYNQNCIINYKDKSCSELVTSSSIMSKYIVTCFNTNFNSDFNNKDTFEKHLECNISICLFCGISFLSKSEFVQHMQRHDFLRQHENKLN